MTKSVTMESFLDDFTKKAFRNTRTVADATKTCVICGGLAKEFRDKISEKEYEISKMCQKCQDSVFGGEDD